MPILRFTATRAGEHELLIAEITQKALAEIIGTTRPALATPYVLNLDGMLDPSLSISDQYR